MSQRLNKKKDTIHIENLSYITYNLLIIKYI